MQHTKRHVICHIVSTPCVMGRNCTMFQTGVEDTSARRREGAAMAPLVFSTCLQGMLLQAEIECMHMWSNRYHAWDRAQDLCSRHIFSHCIFDGQKLHVVSHRC